MRVRPFFWLLLFLSCASILIFAAIFHVPVPAVMHLHVDQHPVSVGLTTVKLHLSDAQGLPIDNAEVFSSANMTNMHMVSDQSSVRYLGQGDYAAQISLYMSGPWIIFIQAQAAGFDSPRQTLHIQVQ